MRSEVPDEVLSQSAPARLEPCGRGPRPAAKSGRPRLFPAFVAKMRQALTFSATIGADVNPMKTITVIAILALLTISGAVISDQILTGQERLSQTTN
jgi:hypothetical protein